MCHRAEQQVLILMEVHLTLSSKLSLYNQIYDILLFSYTVKTDSLRLK
jgi:hypothetical protein